MAISAVILTKNEEANLEKCLASVRFCDEILVIDDFSADNTISIAQKHGAVVVQHALAGDFSQQRNFGLEKATEEWVLFIDADEVVSPSLREEIESRITNYESRITGYYIKRIDYMWGREIRHGEMGNMWLIRLAKKNAGTWKGVVHETWQVKGEIGTLKNPLQHFPHPSIGDMLAEINFYSSLRAEELYKANVHVSFLNIILYTKRKFLMEYIFQLGFLDGVPGLLLSLSMSFYSFLVRGKLWQLQQKN